jgi:hypothetical protein
MAQTSLDIYAEGAAEVVEMLNSVLEEPYIARSKSEIAHHLRGFDLLEPAWSRSSSGAATATRRSSRGPAHPALRRRRPQALTAVDPLRAELGGLALVLDGDDGRGRSAQRGAARGVGQHDRHGLVAPASLSRAAGAGPSPSWTAGREGDDLVERVKSVPGVAVAGVVW